MRHSLLSIEEAVIRQLLHYWRSACPTDAEIPPRKSIDPTAMPTLLPHIALLDVLRTPPWLRCRLAGEEVERRFGRSLRGATLETLSLGGEAEDIERQYHDCIAEQEPVYCSHRFIDLRGKPLHYHRLAVPLSDGAGNVSHLLLGFRFIPWSESDAVFFRTPDGDGRWVKDASSIHFKR